MKKTLLIAVAVIILLSAYSYHKNNSPASIISGLTRKSGLKPGDLEYKVNLIGIIPVGNAILESGKPEEYNRRKVYHLAARAESARILSKFFSAKAALDSYVDTEKLNPLLFRQKIAVAGRQNMEKEALYDQNAGIMSIAGVRREILSDTQDPLSAIFNLRRMDLDKIKEFEININTNQKNYILKGKVTLKDIYVNKKAYKAALIKAAISRRNKSPYHQSRLTMIILRDKGNIPVLIRVFASGMLITANLTDIK